MRSSTIPIVLAVVFASVVVVVGAPLATAALGAGSSPPPHDVTVVDVVPENRTALSGVFAIESGTTMLVRGTTNRRPDTNAIDVEVISGPDADRFGFAVVDTWGFDGNWSARLTVPEDARPGTYTLSVTVDGERDVTDFEVVAEKRARLSVTRTATDGVVVVDSVTVPDGGYVELRSGAAVVGASSYLTPGTHEDLRVSLTTRSPETTTAVAVLGTRERRLEPYTWQGAPVAVDVPRASPTATRTPTMSATQTTATATRTASPTATSTPKTSPTPTTSSESPGFGPLVAVVTVVAVSLAAALVTRARR